MRVLIEAKEGEERPRWCPLKLCPGCDVELGREDQAHGFCLMCGADLIHIGPLKVEDLPEVVFTCAVCDKEIPEIPSFPECVFCKEDPMPPHKHYFCNGPHASTPFVRLLRVPKVEA